MAFHNLDKTTKRVRLTTDGTNYRSTAGTTDTLTSNSLDMLGWDGVLFIQCIGAITATGTVAMKVQSSTDDAVADAYADVTGATVAIVAADANTEVALNIYRPKERYLKVLNTRATANAALDSLVAILYKGNQVPFTGTNATESHSTSVYNV